MSVLKRVVRLEESYHNLFFSINSLNRDITTLYGIQMFVFISFSNFLLSNLHKQQMHKNLKIKQFFFFLIYCFNEFKSNLNFCKDK